MDELNLDAARIVALAEMARRNLELLTNLRSTSFLNIIHGKQIEICENSIEANLDLLLMLT